MLSFLLGLAWQAFLSIPSSFGETYKTLLLGAIVAILSLLLKAKSGFDRKSGKSLPRHLWSEIYGHWSDDFRYVLGAWMLTALLLFIYNFLGTVRQIKSTPIPLAPIRLWVPGAPASAFEPPSKNHSAEKVIIENAPSLGNIKNRAVGLSDQIMGRLYMYGFPRPP